MYRKLLPGLLLAALPLSGGGATLRELSTDRPDQTESPYTVDAGRWQVELDVANLTLDRDAHVRTRVWSFGALNLKTGLTPRMDLQMLFDTHLDLRVEDRRTGAVVRARGFGDITTRLKINVWGNDGGKTALAIMPFVKWPLSASDLRNGEIEGGLIIPFAMELPGGWGLGAMTEVDWVSDGSGGYDTEWLNTITFGRDFGPRWGGYIELAALTGDAGGFRWQGQLDLGFTYALGEHGQLDFGCNFGITDAAPDYQPFLGYSRKF